MDAATYSDPGAARFVEERFVPLRLSHDGPEALERGVRSTPTLVLEQDGGEFHRVDGVHPPADLVRALELGLAKRDLERGGADVCPELERLAGEAIGATRAEAVYRLGRCRFLQSGDRGELKRTYERLRELDPEGPWTAKAAPYGLL